jgi:D-apionolactonase
VRDASWRTPPANLTTVRREASADGFLIELDGEVKQDDIHYRYRLAIEGSSDGTLAVTADAEALSGFLTNRTGFIVLHPIVGVAGRPVTVTHKDGSTSETAFPELISPGQPIFDIRALRHEVTPGLFVTCRMEAALPHDPETIFEMEDQRNWTDASYKTYVGSLLDPWPYRIEGPDDPAADRGHVRGVGGGRRQAAGGGKVTVRFGDGPRSDASRRSASE